HPLLLGIRSTPSRHKNEAAPQNQKPHHDTRCYIAARDQRFTAAQEIERFKAEGGEGSKTPGDTCKKKQPHFSGEEIVIDDQATNNSDAAAKKYANQSRDVAERNVIRCLNHGALPKKTKDPC